MTANKYCRTYLDNSGQPANFMFSVDGQDFLSNETPLGSQIVHSFNGSQWPLTTPLLNQQQLNTESFIFIPTPIEETSIDTREIKGLGEGETKEWGNFCPQKLGFDLLSLSTWHPVTVSPKPPQSLDLLTGLSIEQSNILARVFPKDEDISLSGHLQSTDSKLAYAKQLALNQIVAFTSQPTFKEAYLTAFGKKGSEETLSQELITLINPEKIPDIELIPIEQLKAKGGFDGQTIYLATELLLTDIPETISVLIEEIGHYIDSQINTQDAPGDEGAIFAALVQNTPLNERELS